MSTLDASRDRAAAFAAPAAVDRIQKLAVVLGGVGLLGSALGFFLARDTFFRAYLVGWVYCMGLSLGCLALLMVHHLSRGSWGVVIRRILEAGTRCLPLLAVLSLPLLLGLPHVYRWAQPGGMSGDPVLEHKAAYLNVTWFLVRLALCFVLWIGAAVWLNRLSLAQDRTGDPALFRRMQRVAGPGLIAYALAVTFASVDWLMSLQPHWYSTIYGPYLMVSQALAALSFVIVLGLFLARRPPLEGVLQPRHFHDYGKLFLATVMLWAYFSFSQFLIIWAGNLPEEIHFYLDRLRHGWGLVSLLLVLCHFVLPFLLLLSADLKKSRALAAVAGLMLGARLLELFWQVEPAFEEHHPGSYWLYVAVPLALGGIWLWFFVDQLKRRPLLPINEPYLEEAIAHVHHH
jgi:hypothetical protein